MISFVKGTVVSAAVDHVVVDVGAVGLHVLCTPAVATSLHVGDRVELRTSLIVREDAWTLYGFLDDEERGIFEQVQTVSGMYLYLESCAVDSSRILDSSRYE